MSLSILSNQRLTGNRLAQTLVRQVYPNGSIRSVRRGPLKGLQFRVNRGMGFTYAWGIGEQWNFQELVRPGMCVYDLGANCGQSTLSLAKMVGERGHVIAFEPVERLFADLVSNLELNPSLKVTPVNAAVSNHAGQVDFLFDGDMATQGRIADVEPSYALPNATKISVRAVRLDDYVQESQFVPEFIKVDVEGGASSVLGGAQTVIKRRRPTIYIELHGPEEQSAVRELMTRFGYEARTLLGEAVVDPTSGWFSPLVCRPA